MKTRGESEEDYKARVPPPHSRVAAHYFNKIGNQFVTEDGRRYTVAADGAIVRRNQKTKSKKQRNREKREARKSA